VALEEITIQLGDLEDVRQVLAAALMYFQAEDLQTAQVEFRAARPSPLTQEIERVKGRYDSYLGDFLLARHEALLAEDEPEIEEDSEGAENGSEELAEASEEALSGAPLGDFTPPKQKGRRLKADEV
jgi:hypothetical protein